MTFLNSWEDHKGRIMIPFYIGQFENNIPALLKIHNEYPNYDVVKIWDRSYGGITGYIVTLRKKSWFKRFIQSLNN